MTTKDTQADFAALDVIESWELGYNLGTVVDCIESARHKRPNKRLDDMEKAYMHLGRELEAVRALQPTAKEKPVDFGDHE